MDPLRAGDPREVGPYRLQGRLGGGGMGRVFLGRSRSNRLVAVKLVRPELAGDMQFRRQFALEVAAARRVGGFYTAQVVDADTDADPPWLVTAYIPGPSLREAVEQRGPLPAGAISVLGAGLAEGLAAPAGASAGWLPPDITSMITRRHTAIRPLTIERSSGPTPPPAPRKVKEPPRPEALQGSAGIHVGSSKQDVINAAEPRATAKLEPHRETESTAVVKPATQAKEILGGIVATVMVSLLILGVGSFIYNAIQQWSTGKTACNEAIQSITTFYQNRPSFNDQAAMSAAYNGLAQDVNNAAAKAIDQSARIVLNNYAVAAGSYGNSGSLLRTDSGNNDNDPVLNSRYRSVTNVCNAL